MSGVIIRKIGPKTIPPMDMHNFHFSATETIAFEDFRGKITSLRLKFFPTFRLNKIMDE